MIIAMTGRLELDPVEHVLGVVCLFGRTDLKFDSGYLDSYRRGTSPTVRLWRYSPEKRGLLVSQCSRRCDEITRGTRGSLSTTFRLGCRHRRWFVVVASSPIA
jgi:hypothetical protein